MAATLVGGPVKWGGMTRDNEGHRTYTITFQVITDPEDGPSIALTATGLPQIGDPWAVDNESDPWAFCLPNINIRPRTERDRNEWWELEYTFSTKPPSRCATNPIGNPMLEPPKVSGGFNKYHEEATVDRFGRAIKTSSFEQIRGPQVEFDANRPTVKIEMNYPTLGLDLFAPMVDCVNDRPMWGLQKRCVKLSSARWERKYTGVCTPYYSITLEFDINAKTFDRDILDEGTKALNGRWENGAWVRVAVGGGTLNPDKNDVMDPTKPVNPDPKNPNHFRRFEDKFGNQTKVLLDGHGMPWVPGSDDKVTTCATSPCQSMPKYWAASNLTEEVLLTYESGCTWTYSTFDYHYELTLTTQPVLAPGTGTTTENVNAWVLTRTPVGTGTGLYSGSWYIPTELWKCDGPNTLDDTVTAISNLALSITPSVTLTDASVSPGRVRVEKYDEANFFLMGIPSTL